MPNGMSERSVLIEHCGVGGSARKDTLYPIQKPLRQCRESALLPIHLFLQWTPIQ